MWQYYSVSAAPGAVPSWQSGNPGAWFRARCQNGDRHLETRSQSPFLQGDTGRKSCVCRRAMQSISLRSTEPVICLVHLVPFLKEFAKFFKTAKDHQVGLAGGLMRVTCNRSKLLCQGTLDRY